MHNHILSLLAAGAAAVALAGSAGPATAGPPASGWGARTTAAGWGVARHAGVHHVYRHRFGGGLALAAEPGFSGGRYLADDAWFLSDIGGYLADEPVYPDVGAYGYGYGYAGYSGLGRYGDRRSRSYAVPIHGLRHASRRVVTVRRGAPNRARRHDR